MRRALFGALAVLAFAAGFAGEALAQSPRWPERPIKIIVPYPAGGLSDFQVRAISDSMAKSLGQPVIIDNKPGASASIGTVATATAPADGYTMVFVNNGFAITPHLIKKTGYDPVKDFAPVSLVSTSPMVLVVNNSVPAKTVPEFIEWAKKQPGGVEYGTAGTASFGHMATEQFGQAAGVKLVQVPYKGEAPMTLALRSGEIKFLITTPSPSMMGFVRDGQLRLLGVASGQPAPLLPGVKLMSDTVPGYTAEVWFGLLAPAATPPDIIAKLNAAIVKAVALPDVKEKFAGVGALATTDTPADFSQIVKEDFAKWGDLISKTGMKAE
ncbi:MAG TPA: tripartite tricarboxylate transporter substrate binding protein [Ramlibacter sp.]|jgi:tripartite-type tricarboxylate transporter receptor subunit TctC|nr:tripartite tricarboxylate transporter substrate binding protein [Ramlibacter sp.]